MKVILVTTVHECNKELGKKSVGASRLLLAFLTFQLTGKVASCKWQKIISKK